MRIGQKIVVPASAAPPAAAPPAIATASTTPAAEPAASQTTPANTTEGVVAPGDSLNRLAARYKVAPQTIRELNPNITNWASIMAGQKVLVPVQPGA